MRVLRLLSSRILQSKAFDHHKMHASICWLLLSLHLVCRGWMGEVAADGEQPADAEMMDVDPSTEAAVKQEPAERPVTRERAVGSGELAILLKLSCEGVQAG